MVSKYHYTESGLDTVFLTNGFRFVNSQGGQQVIIEDIEGLHLAIGFALATQKQRLSGKEIRFLRTELLLSQASLAKILGVKDLTVIRWEKDSPPISHSNEAALRSMFLNSVGKDEPIRVLLERLADLEDDMDMCFTLERSENSQETWELVDLKLAA